MKNAIDCPELIKPYLEGKRVGLLTNYTGVNKDFKLTVDIISELCDLKVILSPEHGLYGAVQAGVDVENSVYNNTDIPIISTFNSRDKLDSWTDKIDILVYDIQDVGLRFYTYIYSLSDAMILCKENGIEVLVLDRYNPLGLNKVEGTMLKKEFSSFIGRYPIPSRYALTVGELARYFNEEEKIGCRLTVIPCSGLTRDTDYTNADVDWVPTSPNCSTIDAVLCYVGTVVFEGTNISEGRGTTKPFELFGAPWLKARELTDSLNKMKLPGVKFRYHPFIPWYSKYNGEFCQGVMLHITDKNLFNSFECGIRILDLIRKTHSELEFFRDVDGSCFIDKLLGTDDIRRDDFDVENFLKNQKVLVDSFDASEYHLYK